MLNSIIENSVAINNSNTSSEKTVNQNKLVALLINLFIVLVVNFVFGPYLWNEVMCKLVPACGKARWFDTVALGVLIALIKPN